MLHQRKFRVFEKRILFGIAALLLVAGAVGFAVAVQQSQVRLGLASAGVLLLASVYFYAARRGKPL